MLLSMATVQTRLGDQAAMLRRNNDARQNQQQRRRGKSPAYARHEAYPNEDHQAAYLQGYYNDRMTPAQAVTSPQDALSPSSNSSSTPRKLLQNRRQNMMQRRIEMRQRSEERKRQQRSLSSEHSSANQSQLQHNNNYVHQHQAQHHESSQSQPQYHTQHQPQHISQEQLRGRYPNNLSLLKGHNEQHMNRPSGQHRNVNNPHYPISPPNDQRPPSHPNTSTSSQRKRQQFYPSTQPRHNTQQSPVMKSPPVLDRKQHAMREYPPANLFQGSIHTSSPGPYRDDYGEGFEVEARQLQNASYQCNSIRSPSPYESPSDEILVEDGYYEDEIQQHPHNKDEHIDFMRQQPVRQQQVQSFQQLQQQNMQEQLPKVNQHQPDWHQLNRKNRLYQKKFAMRYQNAATNSSPKFQTQPLQGSELRTSPTKQPNISNFSPVESLSNRNDQIQRKQRQPSYNRGYNGEIQNEFRQEQQQDEESVASVLDRARSFEASYVRKYSNGSEPRSKSVPRERVSQLPSNNNPYQSEMGRYQHDSGRRRSQDSQYVDDDTVTESVASRKKEWEGRFQSNPQKPKQVRQPLENEAFGVWSERANRLTQQRLDEQRTEQRRQRDEQRRSIEENWRRAAKSMSPDRNRAKQEEQHGHAPTVYSESAKYRDEYHFIDQQHSVRYADQPSIGHDSTHMSIEDRRRMLWDGKERLRAVLPKATSFDSAGRPYNNCSPGTASDSQGSFFKSKFVHAAAVATKPSQRASPRSHTQKAGAVSSHYTDSTAGTTPVGSNESSHRTQSTNVSRSANHEQPRDRLSQATQRPTSGAGERSQPAGASNKVSVMPSIAEAPRSSVADLIAKINAVSRSNPAEALAAIDSIIKAESGLSPRNIAQKKHVERAQSPSPPSRPAAAQPVHPLGKDFFQSKYEEVVRETPNNDEDEEDEDESYSSSDDDSTVSSMTNPTYQSIPVHNKSPLESNSRKQPQFSPPIMEELEVKPNKNAKKSSVSHPTSQNATQDGSNAHPNRQRQDAGVVSKPSSDSLEETNKRRSVDYLFSKSSSEEQLARKSPTNARYRKPKQPANVQGDNELDSAWVPVPKNDFFHTGNSGSNKPAETQKPRVLESKPVKESQTRHPRERNESKYLSDTELSQGQTTIQTTGLPSVVSDAFSGIDIDLDEEPASSSVHYQSQDVASQVFSDVDVDLEPKKSVRQRRQELEYLAKSWSEKSPVQEEGNPANTTIAEKLNSHGSTSKAASNYDWAATPEGEKKRVKAEPALRLKGSKKLAQKFASLVKAFESDVY